MKSLTTRRGVLPVTIGAVVFALALGGCGGSSVEDAAGGGESTTQESSAPDLAGSGTVYPGPNGAAQAPGATAAPDADVAGGAAGTAASAGTSTGGTKNTSTGTGTKGGGAAAPGSLTAAVSQLVATAPMLGGSGSCNPATLSEIQIGNVSTLSGVLGELFEPVVPALNVFVAAQNACGGLNGHKIVLSIADDQGDPSTASTQVQNLIQTKKVLAFVGNIQVLTVDAIVPVIKKFGIPVIGSDLTNNTWFTNPLMFPQGASQQAVSYGFVNAAMTYHKNPNLGVLWCIEVPRACEQSNRAIGELAPKLGATVKKSIQISITAPSYVQQCLEMKNAGVEVVALPVDAATMNRFARSCQQVGFFPKVMPHPLGAGNEKQLLSGNKWLGNGYVPLTVFPWMGNSTPAEKYWQAAVKKYDPGFTTGGAASLGWAAGALLLAASAGLSAENPTTQQFLDALYTFKGQKFTELGGLTGPRTFGQGLNPKVPYCLYGAISNDANTGWKQAISKPVCTDLLAPSDPQASS